MSQKVPKMNKFERRKIELIELSSSGVNKQRTGFLYSLKEAISRNVYLEIL
jgi:hypothetical protein